MLKRRYVASFHIAFISAVILTNFQNCAPAPTSMNAPGGDSTVRLIDDYSSSELQFATNKVEVRDEVASAGVNGLCNNSRNGAHLRFALWLEDDDSRPVLAGESFCRSGQFSLGLIDLDQVVCGIPHRLVVEGDWGGIAQAEFEKRCQPLASEPVAAESMPPGTRCEIEYVPSTQSGSNCTQVCYREDIVVSSSPVESLRCSSLMQKLASP